MQPNSIAGGEFIALRSLLDAAPDAMVLVDRDGEMVFANSQVETMFGYRSRELVGRPVEILLPERYRLVHQHHASAYFAAPHKRPMGIGKELFGLRKDGTEFPVDISLGPFDSDEGTFAWAVIRDTTVHERLNRAKAVSEKLVETAPVLILVLDPEGLIVEMNPYMERVTGFIREEVVGQSWFESFLPAEDREAIRAVFGEALEVGVVHINPIITRSGLLRDIEWHVQALIDDQGHPAGLLTVGHDVTERLTRDEELRKADEVLLESDRHKNEFLATLAHELRNPLAPLQHAVEMLEIAKKRPEIIDRLQPVMARQLSHLTRLVDDLFDISRISQGKVELRRRRFEMNEAIENAVEQMASTIAEREHELHMDLSAAALHVDGDPDRLTQVVANLLGNAAKYTEPGGTISVSSEAAQGEAVVHVRDTGFGIAPENLDRLFNIFTQVPEHQSRTGGGGLGIGLALVKQVIEMHGGFIEAHSEGIGRGSEFIVHVPLMSQ